MEQINLTPEQLEAIMNIMAKDTPDNHVVPVKDDKQVINPIIRLEDDIVLENGEVRQGASFFSKVYPYFQGIANTTDLYNYHTFQNHMRQVFNCRVKYYIAMFVQDFINRVQYADKLFTAVNLNEGIIGHRHFGLDFMYNANKHPEILMDEAVLIGTRIYTKIMESLVYNGNPHNINGDIVYQILDVFVSELTHTLYNLSEEAVSVVSELKKYKNSNGDNNSPYYDTCYDDEF